MLLTETKRTFEKGRLLVTVAQAGWQDLGRIAYDTVDRVHLMAYDHPFPHSTLEKCKADIAQLMKQGCPADKLVLGIPFYGRNKTGVARTYAELVGKNALKPNIDEVNGFAFNGPDTINAKLRYAASKKLAGVMVWELGQDATGASSLLSVIASDGGK